MTDAMQALENAANKYGPRITGRSDPDDEAAWAEFHAAHMAVGREWGRVRAALNRNPQCLSFSEVSLFENKLRAWCRDVESLVQGLEKPEYRFSDEDRAEKTLRSEAYRIETRLARGGNPNGEPADSGGTNTPPAELAPEDPIPLKWLRGVVPKSKVKGDAWKLAVCLRRRRVPVFKILHKNYADRADLLRLTDFRAGSRVHQLIQEYKGDGG